mmetsp:Transcript_9759/g.26017  ORF Transcript_9759/g.26017 Transcript_9759/m.26017 type:complete len:241 (-) Transcript_9759:141-863(-)
MQGCRRYCMIFTSRRTSVSKSSHEIFRLSNTFTAYFSPDFSCTASRTSANEPEPSTSFSIYGPTLSAIDPVWPQRTRTPRHPLHLSLRLSVFFTPLSLSLFLSLPVHALHSASSTAQPQLSFPQPHTASALSPASSRTFPRALCSGAVRSTALRGAALRTLCSTQHHSARRRSQRNSTQKDTNQAHTHTKRKSRTRSRSPSLSLSLSNSFPLHQLPPRVPAVAARHTAIGIPRGASLTRL